MKIREAKLKDKKEISNLYYQLYPKRKQKRVIPIKNFNAKNFLLVSEENKKVIGFIWITFIYYGVSRFGYIEELFVKKEFRNKGIGTALVKDAIKRFKKLKTQAIFVTTTEKKAITFYKKIGFKTSKGWFYYKVNK